MDLSLWPLLLIILFAFAVESIVGFGSTVLSLTLGAQFMPIEQLVPLLMPSSVLLSAYLLWHSPGQIDKKELTTKILPLSLPGLAVGIWLYHISPGQVLKLVFGIVIVALAIFELLPRSKKSTLPLPAKLSAVVLFCGGIMQGVYTAGGPFIVYYTSRAITHKSRFRGTLSALWLVLNIIMTAQMLITGVLSQELLLKSVFILPSVLIGIFIGVRIHERISEQGFIVWVYRLLLVSGSALIWKALS